MSKRQPKAYSKDSTVPNIGKGLFAINTIKEGSIIAEFKGKLKAPGTPASNTRSCIFFHDNYFLDCPSNDLASYANDAINFSRERRKLMEALKSNNPFYAKHSGTKINADIKINNDLHRAWLIATTDIAPDEEIFCHYGFPHWFQTEFSRVGFLQEDEIEMNGFPNDIFKYPAFISYVKEFYPKCIAITAHPYKRGHDVIIKMSDGNFMVLPLKNYNGRVDRIPTDKIEELRAQGIIS